jgi:ribonuclease PH
VTAEYAMLPRATNTRNQRDGRQGRVDGRSQEIQRLVGRALRSVVDMPAMGERTITVDCDVLQADAGTRCASITGGFVALYAAFQKMHASRMITKIPVSHFVAAVSVGLVDGEPRLDLSYIEDYVAEVDMNCVAADDGRFIEIQATGEKRPFSRVESDLLQDLALKGMADLNRIQREVLGL